MVIVHKFKNLNERLYAMSFKGGQINQIESWGQADSSEKRKCNIYYD